MRRTRFRKRRQLWLPAYGTGGTFSEGVTNGIALGGAMELHNDGTSPGGIDWLTAAVTFDTQISPEDAETGVTVGAIPPTLRDLVSGSEWALRRVVGKCFVTVTSGVGTVDPSSRAPAIEVGCGLIVCNTDEDGVPTTDFDQVNPLAQTTAEDPWVWLRHWLLTTVPPVTGAGDGSGSLVKWVAASHLPMNNTRYGSVMDGPHVDQKTARRIHRDQRLFFVMATRPTYLTEVDDPTTGQISVYARYMFRFLGNTIGSRGNRGNAAR